MNYKSKLQKAGLVTIAILLSLFIAEVVLRLIYQDKIKYYVWQPNMMYMFHPDASIFYGVSGEKHFSINEDGCRGDEFIRGRENYLCLGGSTTECLYLDDKETWCYLLQQNLNRGEEKKFSISSIGKSGVGTREHYLQMKYFVPQLSNLKGVILTVGINDMFKRLAFDTLYDNNFHFTQRIEDSLSDLIFIKINPKPEEKGWRKLKFYQLLNKTFPQNTTRAEKWEIQDDKGESDRYWRSFRKNSKQILDTLPNLESGLAEFERNLNLIIDEAHKNKLKIIFVNQPALYKDSLSEYEKSLIWMGGVRHFQNGNDQTYYSVYALKKALHSYNKRLYKVCKTRNIKFIDLDSQLPKDTSVFYDDCHFNEAGSRKVAAIIARQMME